jgi:hypothetical protein
MMECNTCHYRVYGLCPSSNIIKSAKFWELDLSMSSGGTVGETCAVGYVRKSTLNIFKS